MRLLFSFSTLHWGGFYAWEWGRGEPIYDMHSSKGHTLASVGMETRQYPAS